MNSPRNHTSDSRWQDSDLDASELAATAALLAALAQPRLACELAGEHEAVAAMTARIRPRRRPRLAIPGLRIPVPSFPHGGAARLAAVTGCLLVASTGAAFAGVLPAAAQDAARSALAHVGVSVPAGHTVQPADAPPAATTGSTAGSTKGSTISGIAKDPSTSGRDKGAAVSSQASGGHSKAGANHSSATGKGSSDQATGTSAGGGSPTAATHRQNPPTPPAPGAGTSQGQSGDHAQTGGGSTTGSAHPHG
jgi:hypothetical protein